MTSNIDFQDYHKWVQEESDKNQGSRIAGNGEIITANYIPIEALRRYWQRDRIQHFLRAAVTNSSKLLVEDIQDDYLRIFATLVYISHSPHTNAISYLDQFSRQNRTDIHLPIRRKEDLREIFSDSSYGRHIRQSFYEHQFLFNPWPIAVDTKLKLHQKDLANEDILPIVYQRDLSSNSQAGMSTTTLKLFSLQKSSGLVTVTNTVVAKIFPEDERDYTFENELNAYSTLHQNNDEMEGASRYFLAYYGSFIQNGVGVILLEYADHGSLLEFFKKGNIPYQKTEILDLWASMADLLRGLAQLHNLNERTTNHKLRGVHQDLKPSNIFVFSQGAPFEYRFTLKIGDFGLSSFQLHDPQKSRKNNLMPDKKSTKIYGAPEIMTWNSQTAHLDSGVDSTVDMWSIGCLMFELVVWTICGQRGLDEFFADRLAETDSEVAGCRGSFHNGKTRLIAVDNMIFKLRSRQRRFDNLSETLCTWLCRYFILLPADKRFNADHASYDLENIIEDAKYNRLPEPSNELPNTSGLSLLPSQESPGSPPPPHASLDRTQTYTGNSRPYDQTTPPHQRLSYPGVAVPFRQSSGAVANLQNPNGDPFTTLPTQSEPNITRQDSSHRPYIRKSPTTGGGHVSKSKSSFVPSTSSAGRRQTYDYELYNERRLSFFPTVGEEPEINGAEGGLTSNESPGTSNLPPSPPPTRHQASSPGTMSQPTGSNQASITGSTRSDTNEIGVKQLIEWWQAKRTGGARDLPEALRDIQSGLAKRDQVFLIDNSPSMLRHWAGVKDTMIALISIVKSVDPDGVELRFTSRPTTSYKIKNVNDLPDKLSSNTPRNSGNCMIASALSTLIDHLVPLSSSSTGGLKSLGRALINRSAKSGISIYILTNGSWSKTPSSPVTSTKGPPHLCGVDGAIRTLVERLRDGKRLGSYVTLQFIRFGHDPVGKQRLRYLDNNLDTEDWDIVDRRYWERSVKAILLGPLAEQEYPSDDSDDGGDT